VTKITWKKDNLEKLLFYALGVAPDEFGLWPDEEGFVPLKEVIGALRAEAGFKGIVENQVREAVGLALSQGPLEIEGAAIRVKPGLAETPKPEPAPKGQPKLLYIGLKPQAWPHAAQQGLKPKPGQSRLRLFSSKERAQEVAARFVPEPVVVAVNRALAEKDGTEFLLAGQLYLAGSVPPAALFGPPVKEPAEAEKPATPVQPVWPGPVVHRGKTKGRRDDSPDWKNQTRRDRRKK
jgi:putative RNA 2'-phosphotransferase